MTQVQILPPAAKFLKKLKDKKLKSLYKEAIEMICEDYSIGEEKTGDLAGMYGYDIYYNKTNYELAYRVRQLDDLIIIVIMAGTRENFYEELKRYIRTIEQYIFVSQDNPPEVNQYFQGIILLTKFIPALPYQMSDIFAMSH